jgi:hypothetical protein
MVPTSDGWIQEAAAGTPEPLSPGRGIVRSCETPDAPLCGKATYGELFRAKECDEASLAGTINNRSLVEQLRPRREAVCSQKWRRRRSVRPAGSVSCTYCRPNSSFELHQTAV